MRRLRNTLVLLGLAAVAALHPLLASARSKNEEGNRLYKAKKYAEALRRYTEAQLEAPDAPQLHYNLGNTLYRQGELEKARDEYRRSLAAGDRTLDREAVYNLGNAHLAQEQYQDAIAAYQRALKLNPGDSDAKRNLELALLGMRRKQQQQSSSGGERDRKGKQAPSEQKKEAAAGDKSGKPEGSEGRKESEDRKQGAGGAKGNLSKEEAERILNALQEDEKANLRQRLEAARENQEKVEQDW